MNLLNKIFGIFCYALMLLTFAVVAFVYFDGPSLFKRGDDVPMTKEELDWYSGRTPPAPGVYAPHPESEYK